MLILSNDNIFVLQYNSKIINMDTESKFNKLKPYLKRGDAGRLAKLTGYSVITIRRMMNGERALHPLVVEAAERLIESRRKRIDSAIETEANRINP